MKTYPVIHNRVFLVFIAALVILVTMLILNFLSPVEGQGPHPSSEDLMITMINQSLTIDGQQLHLEFQANGDPANCMIVYVDNQGNVVETENVWSVANTTAVNVPMDTMRIYCSFNCNMSADGYLWLPEWDTNGFFGLSRRFVSIDYQGKELSFITNVRSPVGIILDGHTVWLQWYTIDYGVYRAVIPVFTACRFTMPIEGYPWIFLNNPITTDGSVYKISANCPTPTPVPTIPAPTPAPTIPAPTPTPIRVYIPLLLR